jgi:hypothetical protein
MVRFRSLYSVKVKSDFISLLTFLVPPDFYKIEESILKIK